MTSLQMSYMISPASHKLPMISKLLIALKPVPSKTIIYLSTCAAVDYLRHLLPSILLKPNGQPFNLMPLHGKQPPKVRQKTFSAFANAIEPSVLLTTDVAARGLDIPSVNLVLQLDPPTDPKVFLHRCGRAGRAGQKGLSVVLLQPSHEEDYIRYLERRETPITPLIKPVVSVDDEDVQSTTSKMRQSVLEDRALHDKAQRGFVSSIRAYRKHLAQSIFNIDNLDWEDLGKAWGLLKLPKMSELKDWNGDRSLDINLDWTNYAYKDKKREEMRQAAVPNQPGTPILANSTHLPEQKKLKRAWSNKLDAREERELRRTKKHKKRDLERRERMTPSEREKQLELEHMIEEVRARNLKGHESEEFEGFAD